VAPITIELNYAVLRQRSNPRRITVGFLPE
jgi:hypothetical protein